jgi:hypothetical protein
MKETKGMVTKLFYRLDCTILFFEPDPILGKNEIGSFELKDEVLTIELASECKLIAEARHLASHFIKAWQIEAEICRHPCRNFRFAFWKAETTGAVVDQTEHAPESLKYEKDNKGQLIIELGVYPPAPSTRFPPHLEVAWSRYLMAFYDCGEPIQSAAYYSLTVAEQLAGNRENAASKFQIDKGVLKKLGELTSTRGSVTTARKMLSSMKPLTSEETRWIDQAVRMLLLHLGEAEAGGLPDRLTMADLPDLSLQ